jgi:hypothetical protein
MSTLYYLVPICAAQCTIRWFIGHDGHSSTSAMLAIRKNNDAACLVSFGAEV